MYNFFNGGKSGKKTIIILAVLGIIGISLGIFFLNKDKKDVKNRNPIKEIQEETEEVEETGKIEEAEKEEEKPKSVKTCQSGYTKKGNICYSEKKYTLTCTKDEN